MKELEMFVRLIIPDTTAITARFAMEKMGYKIKDVKREDYYKFFIDDDKDLTEELGKVDILVNANKHRFRTKVDEEGSFKVLVQDDGDNGAGVLHTLRNRLGFSNISKVEKGTFWTLYIEASEEEAKKIGKEITKNLLMNENYQNCRLL